MNKIARPHELMVPKVTTGPIYGSGKIYDEHAGVRVPFRQIALTDPEQPTFRVYDSSGPYTDDTFKIDVEKGLPRVREAWVKERGGVEQYEGREIKPEDNGNVTAKHLARDFPNRTRPFRGEWLGCPFGKYEPCIINCLDAHSKILLQCNIPGRI